ncbi:hypothetical protein ACFL11_00325 [Patescibacteria group bacterium]
MGFLEIKVETVVVNMHYRPQQYSTILEAASALEKMMEHKKNIHNDGLWPEAIPETADIEMHLLIFSGNKNKIFPQCIDQSFSIPLSPELARFIASNLCSLTLTYRFNKENQEVEKMTTLYFGLRDLSQIRPSEHRSIARLLEKILDACIQFIKDTIQIPALAA